MLSININIDDTIDLIRSIEHVYHRKNTKNLDSEVRRNIRFLFDKDFIKETKTTYGFKYATNELTVRGDSQILDLLIGNVQINDKQCKVFLPIIYYMLANVPRIGRMVVYKKNRIIKNQSEYLVHRSNIDLYPLEHPGGHIEYIEFFNNDYCADSTHDTLRSGKSYVQRLINQVLISKNDSTGSDVNSCVDLDMIKWIFCGTCREVFEESGLDLYGYAKKTDLIKIGSKTYYFSVEIDHDQKEEGPLDRFRNEIFTNDNEKKFDEFRTENSLYSHRSMPMYKPSKCIPITKLNIITSEVSTTVSISPNYYNILCNIEKEENTHNSEKNTCSDLDKFWGERCDRRTFHAWISSDEMIHYWDNRYLYHINDVIDIIN